MATKGPFPRLFPRLVPVPASQIKAASSTALLPRGAYGAAYEFFSPDGGNTIIDLASMQGTAFALVAYWYVAARWRAQKIAEAPLIVVEEDQDDGSEEWLPEHELAEVLDEPSVDYDMGELIERTSRYLDNTGAALWVIDADRGGRVARLTPFHRNEFEVHAGNGRLFNTFTIQTREGPLDFSADEVCYFRDECSDTWLNDGRSRLDVAMNWLRLGEKSRQTIRDLLNNSIWPSATVIPDKDWNPDPETLQQYKNDLANYGAPGNQGKPFVQLGGGSFMQLSAKIKELVPSEVLNRVESVVAAVSGVPAVVLQFLVGMENSPWSQMAQARRMAYDDTINPSWRKLERVLTRQLLRPRDDDTTHVIRFDRTGIASLQEDLNMVATTVALIGRQASLNERREMLGLDPSDDPKADDIPELNDPLAALLAGGGAPPGTEGDDPAKPDDPKKPPVPADSESPKKIQSLRVLLKKRLPSRTMVVALRNEAQPQWQVTALGLLHVDATKIADIAREFLTDATHKSIQSKERGKQRVMQAVLGYLREESIPAWAKATTPLLVRAAERSTAIVAADLGVRYNLLHPNLLKFARREAGDMVQGVSKTTRVWVNDVITAGLEEGRTTNEIATLLEESAAFTKDRALLIARTETTRAFNGAPHESLVAVARSTDRVFTKTWSGALDANERDEHTAMEGETVPIDEPFSNGSQYPDEPNCRCVALYNEVEN